MINTWQKFHTEVRNKQARLLVSLVSFPRAVLVTGCQRSGTTLVSRLISKGPDFHNFHRNGEDEELIAALTLAGHHELSSDRRFCFQTTYLNEHVDEYSEMLPDQKLIWVVREPQAVIYSMLHNWDRFPLNELFGQCGLGELNPDELDRFYSYGYRGIPKIRRAICAHNGKLRQLFSLQPLLKGRIHIMAYEKLVHDPVGELNNIHHFIEARSDPQTVGDIRSTSLIKSTRLKTSQFNLIMKHCNPLYQRAVGLIGS